MQSIFFLQYNQKIQEVKEISKFSVLFCVCFLFFFITGSLLLRVLYVSCKTWDNFSSLMVNVKVKIMCLVCICALWICVPQLFFSFVFSSFSSSVHEYSSAAEASVWTQKFNFDEPDAFETTYALSSEENECFKSSFLFPNETIRFRALTSRSIFPECNVTISTNSSSWFAINVHNIEASSIYSTFIVEKILENPENGTKNVVLFPFHDTNICHIGGKSIALHVRFAYIDIQISVKQQLLDDQNYICNDEFERVEWYQCEENVHWTLQTVKQPYGRALKNVILFTYPLVCPKNCKCSFGQRQWFEECLQGNVRFFLVCNPNIAGLSLKGKRISTVLPDSFMCFPSLTKLFLNNNSIHYLPMQIFSGLRKLTVLHLGNNILSDLPSQLFVNQNNLQFLSIRSNRLKRVPKDLLSSLIFLKYLDLGSNELSEGTVFEEMVALNLLADLYLDKNELIHLSNSTVVYPATVKYLTFEQAKITKLPDGFFSLHDKLDTYELDTLDLSHNRLVGIKSGCFNKLTLLRKLYLEFNQLSNLSTGLFAPLQNLRSLRLNNNFFTSLPGSLFAGLIYLEEINISSNFIQGVSHLNLPELEILNLNFNEISFFEPNCLQNSQKLVKLDLESNNLTNIPTTIFKDLVILESLILDYNQIVHLSTGVFDSQEKLESLFLGFNRIMHLPTGIFDSLRRLEHLFLDYNQITHLPTGIFDGLVRLEELSLDYNQIKHLPTKIFGSLLRLKHLYLGYNQISNLTHHYFSTLSNLFSLSLNNNDFTALPKLHHNLRLTYLYFAGNNLDVLDTCPWISTIRLVELNISDNEITSIPSNCIPSKVLRLLDISRNRFSHLPIRSTNSSNFSRLIALYAGYNKLFDLPDGIFSSARNIYRLSLEHNRISMIKNHQFQTLKILEKLYLQGNNLSLLPTNVFKTNTKLKVLKLAYNKLIMLPRDIFETHVQLTLLDLTGNKLIEISPDQFDSLGQLDTLFLFNNQVNLLSEPVFHMTIKLRNLNLCCNEITFLSMNIFTSLMHLKILDLSFNNLNNIPSVASCTSLLVLKLNDNDLPYLSFDSFESESKLKVLALHNNIISTILQNALLGFVKLISLSLSSNNISSVENGIFKTLHNLEVLNISDNQLSKISAGAFIGLDNLMTLELQNNILTEFEEELVMLTKRAPNLNVLNISQNHIQRVQKIDMRTRLSNILFDLRGNPLTALKHQSLSNFDDSTILVDKFASCCFVDNNVSCIAISTRSSYLTCKRMLPRLVLRIVMWSVGMVAVVFNIGVIMGRIHRMPEIRCKMY